MNHSLPTTRTGRLSQSKESPRDVGASGGMATEGEASMTAAEYREQRDGWVRLFNRLEGAVAHHRRATTAFREVHDEALYAAHDRVLRDASRPTPQHSSQTRPEGND